jgi:hypothetical protein
MDLNTFTIFYRGHAATDALINQQIDPCFQVCTLRSWPDRPWVMDGTAWIGDDGPEQGVGTFAFFVSRPKLTREAAQSCTRLEVMHVHTDWLGGEIGVSWYAYQQQQHSKHTLPPHSHNNLPPAEHTQVFPRDRVRRLLGLRPSADRRRPQRIQGSSGVAMGAQ